MSSKINIVEPSVVSLQDMDPMRKIEYAYRTCYQSRHLMGDDSFKFISKILYPEDGGTPHSSPLEHVTVGLAISLVTGDKVIRDWQEGSHNHHLQLCFHPYYPAWGCFWLWGNLRAFFDFWSDYDPKQDGPVLATLKYYTNARICEEFPIFKRLDDNPPFPAEQVPGYSTDRDLIMEYQVSDNSPSFNIVTTRDILQELVRHRTCSFSVESTRYCNYEKKGFTFVRPDPYPWAVQPLSYPKMYQKWYNGCQDAANNYLDMLNAGAKPEEARMLLPGGLKTELVMTADVRDWRRFLQLRNHKSAHPQIRIIAEEIAKYVS